MVQRIRYYGTRIGWVHIPGIHTSSRHGACLLSQHLEWPRASWLDRPAKLTVLDLARNPASVKWSMTKAGTQHPTLFHMHKTPSYTHAHTHTYIFSKTYLNLRTQMHACHTCKWKIQSIWVQHVIKVIYTIIFCFLKLYLKSNVYKSWRDSRRIISTKIWFCQWYNSKQ